MKLVKLLLIITAVTGLILVSQVSHARHAALLIDADNGDVLYELEANQSWYPASLTKLMTLYMTFDALESGRLRLTDQMNISPHAARQPTSRLGLRVWDTISVEDAILAVVTKSANDAAVVLAERLGGSENRFAASMTTKAHNLGMTGSHFMNATGLPHDWQSTTAHDMALLAYKLIHNFPQYYPYFGVDSLYYDGRFFRSSNKFLLNYPGAEGMKTGYTCGSGYNLVASATLYGRRLIGVILGGHTSYERYQQMFTMMDIGFSDETGSYRTRNITSMSHTAIGTPPYQLSCGHKPSARYAARSFHENDDDDDTHIRYVKKNLRPKRATTVSHKHQDERSVANEITKISISGNNKSITKSVSATRLAFAPKTAKASKAEGKTISRNNKRDYAVSAKTKKSRFVEVVEEEVIEPKTSKSKSKTAAKSTKSKTIQLAKASKEKSKGYYVPGKEKPGKTKTASKSKGYYTPDTGSKATAKTVNKTTAKNKKTSKKKS